MIRPSSARSRANANRASNSAAARESGAASVNDTGTWMTVVVAEFSSRSRTWEACGRHSAV
ncbi:hypothetical protein [Nocardia sp. NBC_01377]|uniref:hypothetical protein n=1 Tax=Nocardia sp. NBC_01377 TaxID=2903595 RepID=UPI003864AD35